MNTTMSPEYLSALLGSLPAYTEATFVTQRGDRLRGIARDMPRTDGTPRRWTVNGWEWFFDADTARNIGLMSVEDITITNVEVIDF